jgi:hypothetical protein
MTMKQATSKPVFLIVLLSIPEDGGDMSLYSGIIGMFFFQVPLILLVKSPDTILSMLSGLFLIAVSLLILTPLGFPYSSDPAAPAPQRFMIAVSARIVA